MKDEQGAKCFINYVATVPSNFNEHFKAIFDGHSAVPTKGLAATSLWALGGVFVYQLGLLYRYAAGLEPRQGLKALRKAA